ncbi:OmpA/MotB family protein [Halomonas urumqiensis]|uniref:Flagellar motor protein MotB n=1 Tax=Halomonas urumqiensis TaxID=1684789 RepID=A0A2N7UKC6_9GAMM|nr:OmpA family protein [Halomonas urumqiensis]PMR80869.1 flagellar motor protein MotB [Halomonas urumqiensis]PTB02826.1 flagellar motor protein MotB [Halomonas urumqiensis]GHE21335.1 chemotaxis protein MotB [Halomonas urumqiensis]
MLDRDSREALLPGSPTEGDGEGWLVSYLDVLTLLITLFVLLLSMAGSGMTGNDTVAGGGTAQQVSRQGEASALAVNGLAPLATGLEPRHDGLKPRFRGLEMEGVSVAEGEGGITLRIDDNLLFDSGQARLTTGGGEVLQRLVGTLAGIEGRISVEGHTDNVPIATARFPSNWELSTARAIAVLRYLAGAGLAQSRLRAIGYADTQPLVSNETAEGRAANRRVELLLNQLP